jgi:hypothetical protein
LWPIATATSIVIRQKNAAIAGAEADGDEQPADEFGRHRHPRLECGEREAHRLQPAGESGHVPWADDSQFPEAMHHEARREGNAEDQHRDVKPKRIRREEVGYVHSGKSERKARARSRTDSREFGYTPDAI